MSDFAGDADLGELVEMYVDEMPQRVQSIIQAYETQDWELLGRLAHQTKGAAGSYGFHQITALAESLEHAVRRSGDQALIATAFDRLVDVMKRAEV
ncbi:MAG: Hpt domain-containing protein [Pirellulaceae bacterium]|nr:Hpt domain-containing protein [Planctomycetales bacterium]